MKIKRLFYYSAVLGGAILLIFSSGFGVPEYALALGFALLMAGLYGLTRGRGVWTGGKRDTDEKFQDGGQGPDDR